MTGRQPRPARAVVVTFDGVALASPALHWAAREAVLRQLPLVVVQAYGERPRTDRRPADGPVMGEPGPDDGQGAVDNDEGGTPTNRERAWRLADAAVATAVAVQPTLQAYAWAAAGPLPDVLGQAVADPALVVVGTRGRGVLLAFLRGAHRAGREGRPVPPVVLARQDSRAAQLLPAGPSGLGLSEPPVLSGLPVGDGHLLDGLDGHVVVGVDGGASTRAVVGFGFDIAARRDARLLAVPVPPRGDKWWTRGALDTHVHGVSAPGMDAVEALLAPHRSAYPGVEATVANGDGTVAGPLRIARPPDLLVVGSRDAGVSGLLGSTLGCTAINRARCPVALVPVPAEERRGGRIRVPQARRPAHQPPARPREEALR
ncbi:universal stress protein [Actinopolymorpha rutila]|uniref:Nucleotide-binding universal stress UspA family protein n=1 Tax=Actinopolymorpha rutila TaxID=446787 RepID=A0A852Z8G9_9ACTN|nr:universal stress protein [Actinopolymorpha rutila]NYH89244.1 nucleotide-binding universal stress UspA family protein [Actinopolymorpha rutila]